MTSHSPGGPGGSRIGGARILGGNPGGGPGGIPGGLPGGGPGGNMRGGPPMGPPRSGGGRNIIGGSPGGGPGTQHKSDDFMLTWHHTLQVKSTGPNCFENNKLCNS